VSLVLPTAISAFSRGWTTAEREWLARIVDQAEQVDIVDPEETLGTLAYDRRNEVLAARADLVVAVWTGLRRGGTFYTLCTARELSKPVEEILMPRATNEPVAGRGI
jgi:hypothetical protein